MKLPAPSNGATRKTPGHEAEAIDATVTSALRTLTAATPPSGMEVRILSHLQQRAQSGPSTLLQRLSPVLPQLAIAALVAAFFLAGAIILHPAHRQPAAPSIVSSAVVPSSQRLVPSASIDHATHQSPSRLHAIHRIHPASASARLISFPAPPEPLTEQERLLLALAASHPSPEVIAALDPVQRAAADARSEQQFLASLKVNDPKASTSSGDSQ